MAKTCLFLMISLAALACTFDTAGAPVGDDQGTTDAATDDRADASHIAIDASLAIDAAPLPVDAAPPVLVPPGANCTCDADCAGEPGHPGACVYGVCMTRASAACAFGGSQAECPDGSRCWNLSGQDVGPLCWPDCDAHTCSGTCDADDSCIPSSAQDCLASCSAACS